MSTGHLVSTSENLLPLSLIKRRARKTPMDSAELHMLGDGSLCMFLLHDQQRILVARRQGDVFRTWRSIDRAVALVKAHFTLTRIQVFLLTTNTGSFAAPASSVEAA